MVGGYNGPPAPNVYKWVLEDVSHLFLERVQQDAPQSNFSVSERIPDDTFHSFSERVQKDASHYSSSSSEFPKSSEFLHLQFFTSPPEVAESPEVSESPEVHRISRSPKSPKVP